MVSHASIVAAVDFSPCSKAALLQALRIASWNGTGVTCVHVIDTLVAVGMQEALSDLQREIHDGLIADARRAWDTFAGDLDAPARPSVEIRIDNRVRGILNVAAEAKAELLVLGAYGDKPPDVGMGTVATGCVRRASCDVLLVRDTQSGRYGTIVACVDFSPTSLAVLERAAKMAKHDGSLLHVLHVFEAPWRELAYLPMANEQEHAAREAYRGLMEQRLHRFAGGLGGVLEELKPRYAMVDSSGHRSTIASYAGEVGADLIVLGTRGRTNLRDVLLGSTAEKALRESRSSVLAVRAVETPSKDEDPAMFDIQARALF